MNLDPRLIPTFALAVAFDIIFPLVVGYFIHRRFGVRWKFFLFGALVFLLSQLLTRVPAVQIIQGMITPALQASRPLLYLWFLILAVTAGLFEEVGRYLGYRFLVKDEKTWAVGLMFGAGHGGLESMLLVGGLALLSLISVIALSNLNPSQMNLPPDQLAQVEQGRQQLAALDWWTPLLGAYERFLTIFLQISLSILVLQTFLRRSLWYLVAAIALHALVDMAALLLAQQLPAIWIEAALTLTLPMSLAIIYYFRPRVSSGDAVLVTP